MQDLEGASVFICHDFMLEEVLDTVATRLQSRGASVVRGPRTAPGPKLVYDVQHHARWFGSTDVAVFSSRSVCSPAVMHAAPRMRGIVNPTVGLETVDIEAATRRGIVVAHAATLQNRTALSEATVMLILMQSYLPDQARDVMYGRRARPGAVIADRWARILAKRTVGLIGMGRIGREVARRLTGFDVRLLCSGRPGATAPADLPPHVEYVDLPTLLQQSDIVSLHVTLPPGAPPVLGPAEFAQMKWGARVINTARGQAIDEDALVAALERSQLAGAALDTFQVEPLPPDSPLWKHGDKLYLTPHLVAQTRDGLSVLADVAIQNIERILHNQPPRFCKNPQILETWQQSLDPSRHFVAPAALPTA